FFRTYPTLLMFRRRVGAGHRQDGAGGARVRALDDCPNFLAALRRRERLIALDRGGLVRQARGLVAFAKPLRVVAAAQVIEPGVIIDAVARLQEEDQVLATQVELLLGPAEVEAALLRQFALGVFSNVPAALGLARRHPHPARLARRA